jgi:hypothetical protein
MPDELLMVGAEQENVLNESTPVNRASFPPMAVTMLVDALKAAIKVMGGDIDLKYKGGSALTPEVIRAFGMVQEAAKAAGLSIEGDLATETDATALTVLASRILQAIKDPKFVESMSAPADAALPTEEPAVPITPVADPRLAKRIARMQ